MEKWADLSLLVSVWAGSAMQPKHLEQFQRCCRRIVLSTFSTVRDSEWVLSFESDEPSATADGTDLLANSTYSNGENGLEAHKNWLRLQSYTKGLKHAFLNFVFKPHYIARGGTTSVYDGETVLA